LGGFQPGPESLVHFQSSKSSGWRRDELLVALMILLELRMGLCAAAPVFTSLEQEPCQKPGQTLLDFGSCY